MMSTMGPRGRTPLDKHRLTRASSLETIKRLNTFICSPQTYILPAILTNWLQTGRKSLNASMENTIFALRYFICHNILLKYLLPNVEIHQFDRHTNVKKIFEIIFQAFLVSKLAFFMTIVCLTVQMCLCCFYLSCHSVIVPLGLSFLLVSTGCIMTLGLKMNRSYLNKHNCF
ncbi:hypothetical protein ABEB36_006175 [Hypothenemus hampei]|uniref:Uncharacterized protein n=1 Tax=Hypothenemus hampei TaxID=57062 RepID=A0ABD1EPM7_HYPHA